MFLEKRAKWPCFDCTALSAPSTLVCAVLLSPGSPVLGYLTRFFHLHLLLSVGTGLFKEPLPGNITSFLSFPLCLSLSITGVVQRSQAQDAALALAGYQMHTGDAGTSSSQ